MIQAWERVGDSKVSRSTFINPQFMASYSKGDLRLTRFFQNQVMIMFLQKEQIHDIILRLEMQNCI